MSARPFVTVVIPTRDRPAELERALLSVARQTYTDWEVVLVDDGSPDQRASGIAARFPKVKYERMDRSLGASAARNHGIARAAGDLVAFLDDDDVWRADFLEMQVAAMRRFPQAVLSYTAHHCQGSPGGLSVPDLFPCCRYGNPFAHLLAEFYIHTMSVVMVRRASLEQAGPLDTSLYCIHDTALYLSLREIGPFCFVPVPLAVKTVHPQSIVRDWRRWRHEERRWIASMVARPELELSPWSGRIRAHRALFHAVLRGGFDSLRDLWGAWWISPPVVASLVGQKVWRRVRGTGARVWPCREMLAEGVLVASGRVSGIAHQQTKPIDDVHR